VSIVEVNQVFPAAPPSAIDPPEFVDLLLAVAERGRSAPFVVPSPPQPFIGYAQQLEYIIGVLSAGGRGFDARMVEDNPAPTPVTTVGGPSGCGVTAFLCQAATSVRASGVFSGGIFFSDLRGVLDVNTGMSTVCRSVGTSVSDSAADALRKWCGMRSKPVLLLVDGGSSAQWLSAFGSYASAAVTIVVGVCGVDASLDVTLNGLSEDEGTELLRNIAPHLVPHAADLCRVTRALPSALTSLSRLPVDVVLGVLQASVASGMTSPTGSSSHATSNARNNSAIHAAALAAVPRDVVAILNALRVFPSTFDVGAAAALADVSESAAMEALSTLQVPTLLFLPSSSLSSFSRLGHRVGGVAFRVAWLVCISVQFLLACLCVCDFICVSLCVFVFVHCSH
jgi:hypothetical protein